MATTLLKKERIENLQIANADVAAGAAIASSKLADGANFTKKDGSVAFIADQSMGGFKLTNLAAPVSANDAARLVDLQNVQAGISGKDAVRVGTTANITLSGVQTIDGIAVIAGDRVLVKNQTTASTNGIYVVATGAWTRADDANAVGDLKAGSFVFITEGTVQQDSAWVLSTDGAITIGTTAINFTQFSGGGQMVGGAGMVKTGNTFDVQTANSGRIVVNADNIDLATTGVTAGTYNGVTVDAYGRVMAVSAPAYILLSNFINAEVLAGTKNGVNTAFTCAFTPQAGTQQVFLDGQLMESGAGNDYTISGSNITMLVAPTYDQKLVMTYWK